MSNASETSAEKPETDGRKIRGQANRQAIVRAMVELVQGGEINPGASRVAKLAGVGLRTVYRHFDDLDSLYREMVEIVRKDLEPLLTDPFEATDVHDRLDELIDRRNEVLERAMPLRIAGNIRRFSSDFIMSDYIDNLRLERESLQLALSVIDPIDEELFESLLVVTSFQCWRGLRLDQKLSVEQADAVTRRLIRSLMKDVKP